MITNAATGNPNVQALVYVDAFVPDEGEAVLPLAGPDSALAVADPTTVFDLRPYPGAAAGDFDVYLKPNVVTDYFAPDLPRRTALAMAATQRPIALSAGIEPSGEPAWSTIPSWYLIGTQDLIIPPAQQRFMAERADAHIVEVKASHVSLISKPQAVARLIIDCRPGHILTTADHGIVRSYSSSHQRGNRTACPVTSHPRRRSWKLSRPRYEPPRRPGRTPSTFLSVRSITRRPRNL